MFDFEPGDEERWIRETAARFAAGELRERLRAHERARGVEADVAKRFTETGLDVLEWPEAAGGQGLGAFAHALVLEELAAVDPGAAVALEGAGPAAYPLIEAGELDLLRELRGRRGVVIDDVEGRFRHDGATLTGEHPWVPAEAPALLVVFQEERAFVITQGLECQAVSGCGLEAAGAARIRLEEAEPRLVLVDRAPLARSRARIRVWLAALLVGAARGAYDYATAYAKERTAFGRPIAHHQALAFLIADMATAVEAARMVTWRAAAALDAGGPADWEAATALAEAAEQALFVGPNAVQLLGGHGFMKDHPVEKWMRDIRTLGQVFGGRDEAELAAAALASGREIGLAR